MDPQEDPAKRWQRIDIIFSEAVEQTGDDRTSFLDRACADDPTLRTEVERLLIADHRAETFLDRPIGKAPSEPLSAESFEGRRIGAYELLSELGQGGMGAVYLARRADDQHERQVAVKLMQSSGTSHELRHRFHNERQALARLEHSYIARMYDSGITPEGQPYLVMEYVRGEPIDRYCDRHTLSIKQRLKLFRQVCEAVEFAHRNLLVHRDIKPTNILVTADGIPKLLDFGIAKLLDAGQIGIDRTQTGLRLMSPRWASPEQVLGQAITTASDIYSLGLLLYSLLTGQHAYHFPENESEAWRVVCEQDPKRPSSVVLKLGLGIRRFGNRSYELRPRLRGDLDNIVLKALEKEPQRRYGSVEQLSDDLRRHLERRPIRARKTALHYRIGKFLRRHRLGAIAVMLIVALTLGFVAALLHQAERTALERDRAEEALAFMLSLFESTSANQGRARDVTAREILALGAERIGSELTEQPEIQATLMDAIGGIYMSLGLFDQAVPLVQGSLERRQRVLGEKHADVATSLNRLAELYHYLDRYDDAEPLYRQALALRRRLPGIEPGELARTLNSLGALMRVHGDVEEARSFHHEALELQRQAPQPAEDEISQTLNYLALIAAREADYQQELELYRQTLDIRRRIMGEDHPGVAHTLINMGQVLNNLGRYRESATLLRQALEINRTKLDSSHPQVNDARARLAESLWQQGQTEAAEPLLRAVLAQNLATYGEDHFEVAVARQSLGRFLTSEGRLDEAERVLQRALASRLKYGEDHPRYAECLALLAEVMYLRGDHVTAERDFRQALTVLRVTLAPGHLRIVQPLQGLGQLLIDRGELEEAEGILREALAILHRTLPPDTLPIAQAEGFLGDCLIAASRAQEAKPLLIHSHAVFVDQLPKGHRAVQAAERRLDATRRTAGLQDPSA